MEEGLSVEGTNSLSGVVRADRVALGLIRFDYAER